VLRPGLIKAESFMMKHEPPSGRKYSFLSTRSNYTRKEKGTERKLTKGAKKRREMGHPESIRNQDTEEGENPDK